MNMKWLWVALLAGCPALAQEPVSAVDLAVEGNGFLTLSWASESNAVYRVCFKTNLLQAQGAVLQDTCFAMPPSNEVQIHRGGVPAAFLYVTARPVLQSDLPYEQLAPGSFSVGPGETNVVLYDPPTYVGNFCITNATQFESLKDELGLARLTIDFSTEVLIGMMAPVTPSITGRYQMDSVRETESEVLVAYDYVSYAPLSSPAFNKAMLVIKTVHRNKPVRLVLHRLFTPNMDPESANIVLFLDSLPFPSFSP